MYAFYSVALGLVLLLTMPYWALQMLRKGKYRVGLSERLGRIPSRLRATRADEECIWVHAVSVGEVAAVSGLIKELQARFPECRVAVTTTTTTGQTLAREKFGQENVFYFPLDFPFAQNPYFKLLRPKLVVLAETEFWPNFLHLAKLNATRVTVVNARISDRSFPRYRRFKAVLRHVLENVDMLLAQSEEDKERLITIGAPAGRTQVSGNLKFDVKTPSQTPIVERLRAAMAPGTQVVICGSTVEGEEELLAQAWKRLLRDHPGSVMVLAPRHPERFAAVAEILRSNAVSFWLRSAWSGQTLTGGIFLLDSIGELASLYALADIAFVGGSLVPRGGHNILEPAQFGKAILVGPYTGNFRDIINIFLRADALLVVEPVNLYEALHRLMATPKEAHDLGERALAVFRAHPGATARTLDALEVLLWMPSSLRSRYQQVEP